MILNIKTLIEKSACEEQVELFRKHFGDEVNVTPELCVSVADKFSWDWAASKLLSEEGRKAYEEAEAPLYKAYEEATAPLLKAYRKATAPSWKAYREATATLRKAYREAEASSWKAYMEGLARTFGEMYGK